MRPTLFLDLDGVLADFVGGALKAHGKTGAIEYRDVRWRFDLELGIEPAEFWRVFGYDFWRGLEWTPDGREILFAAYKVFGPDNVYFLSSSCDTAGCRDGKADWVKDHLGAAAVRRLFLGSAKEAFAGPGKVLADDYERHYAEWVLHGGSGILVPRPWNELRGVEGKTPWGSVFHEAKETAHDA